MIIFGAQSRLTNEAMPSLKIRQSTEKHFCPSIEQRFYYTAYTFYFMQLNHSNIINSNNTCFEVMGNSHVDILLLFFVVSKQKNNIEILSKTYHKNFDTNKV